MKRKTVLFILIAALLAFAVHAADTVNIRLDELGMSLDVPADCSVFTRNMSPDDPALAEYGIDLEQMNQLMAERSIYLDLLSDDPAYEGLVTMVPNVVESMTLFDEDTLESLKEPLTNEYEANGMTVDSVDYFTNDQAVFFRTEGEIAGVKALVLFDGFFHKVLSLDPALAREGDGSCAVLGAVWIVFDLKLLGLALGIVGDDELYGVNNAHGALGCFVQIVAQTVLKKAVIDDRVDL